MLTRYVAPPLVAAQPHDSATSLVRAVAAQVVGQEVENIILSYRPGQTATRAATARTREVADVSMASVTRQRTEQRSE